MLELLWILVAAGIGGMLAYRFGGLRSFAPRWAAALLILGAGTATGIGIASTIFFICRTLVPGFSLLPMLVEIAVAAALGFDIYRTRNRAIVIGKSKPFFWNSVLALVLVVVVGIGASGMSSFWEANPRGNWDAWAIWNLRARFLASDGNLAPRAWSPMLSATHPEYPLLTSGFVARCWSYSGSTGATAPIATGYALFLALVAIGTGGMAALGGGSLGLLFGLAIASSPFLLHEVPAQYADIPLACFFAGAIIWMLLERPLGAGLLASLAAWTKDEGLLFLAAFLVVMAILRRRQALLALAGAIPVGALVLVFKLVLARGTSSLLMSAQGAGVWSKLTDLSRYQTVAGATVDQLWNMRFGWYHPILPVIIIGLVLRFKANWRRDVLPAGMLTAAMTLGYFFIYIITPNDLDWHLQTSLRRLMMQLWPAVLMTLFAGLRAPEETAVEVPVVVPLAIARGGRKRKS